METKTKGFTWDKEGKSPSLKTMIEPTIIFNNKNNENQNHYDNENIIGYFDKREEEIKKGFAEKRRINRLIRRNIQIIRYQLENWDYIIKIRKKYHKKGKLSPKKKRFSRK